MPKTIAEAQRIMPLHSERKVIYVSDCTDDANVHHRLRREAMMFLEKPFTPNTLPSKGRDVLERA